MTADSDDCREEQRRSSWALVQDLACRPAAGAAPKVVPGPHPAPAGGLPALRSCPREIREALVRVRQDYRELYELPLLEYPDGSRSFHNGRLRRCQGVNLLFLQGDHVEMAFQHGRLLADQIQSGAVRQASQLVANHVINAVGKRGAIQKLVAGSVRQFVTDVILRSSVNAGKERWGTLTALEDVAALSDASGIALREFLDAVLAPETIMVMTALGRRGGFRRWSGLDALIPTTGNCTSFAGWGAATRDGQLLIGRNMDYPLNGYYDRFPTVAYFQPAGDLLPYMSFTSAGVHNCGLTAYNAAGIFLASHVVPCTDVSARGATMLSIADQVDPTVHQTRGLGNTVGVHTTMTSVIVDPASGRAYIATGMAPAAHREFLAVPLITNESVSALFPNQLPLVSNSGFAGRHPDIWNALQSFIRAKCAYEYENDCVTAYRLLEETVRIDPSNPAYWFQLGIFALKLRHFEGAIQALDRVFSGPYRTDQLQRLAYYFRGRARAQLGQISAALDDLNAVLTDAAADEQLRTAAQQAAQRLRTWGKCPLRRRSTLILMQQSDTLYY